MAVVPGASRPSMDGALERDPAVDSTNFSGEAACGSEAVAEAFRAGPTVP